MKASISKFVIKKTRIFQALLLGSMITITGCISQPVAPLPIPANPTGPFALGIDVLAESGFAAIRGRRVGLVCNQTSANAAGVPTRLVLRRAPGVMLTALFAPEHGIDGDIPAGQYVPTRHDSLTGLPVHSLYGPTREPSPQMLEQVDVVLFDLQDIGSRSYTYISTMIKCMEACGKYGKTFMVLDRPNPLGGMRVQGPPIERQWISFVGQVPVPYVHGMTAGELARMAVGQGWLAARPQLQVIPMRGWTRSMLWANTGLRWRRTSPNIPHALSPFYYVATGMLGGASHVDIGIGRAPFEHAGGRNVNGYQLASAMQRYGFQGVSYEPYTHNDFGGVRLRINPLAPLDLCALDVALLYEINRMSGGAVMQMSGDKLSLFNKVYGSDALYHQIRQGVPPQQIIAGWQSYVEGFKARRAGYLMYP